MYKDDDNQQSSYSAFPLWLISEITCTIKKHSGRGVQWARHVDFLETCTGRNRIVNIRRNFIEIVKKQEPSVTSGLRISTLHVGRRVQRKANWEPSLPYVRKARSIRVYELSATKAFEASMLSTPRDWITSESTNSHNHLTLSCNARGVSKVT